MVTTLPIPLGNRLPWVFWVPWWLESLGTPEVDGIPDLPYSSSMRSF